MGKLLARLNYYCLIILLLYMYSDRRKDLIKLYFHCGYDYSLIVFFLHFVHGISIFLYKTIEENIMSEAKEVLHC